MTILAWIFVALVAANVGFASGCWWASRGRPDPLYARPHEYIISYIEPGYEDHTDPRPANVVTYDFTTSRKGTPS